MAKPCVFFDLDGTFTRWQFCHDWIVAMVEAGLLPKLVLMKADDALHAYQDRRQDFETFIRALVHAYQDDFRLRGIRVDDAVFVSQKLVRERGKRVHVFTRELNDRAKAAGYLRVIISGSPEIAVKAFGEHYDIPICVGTHHPSSDGVFTGEPPVEWLQRKGDVVERLVNEHDIDLQKSVAIGDSPTDGQMFERVGFPIAFNPNADLKYEARRTKNNWPVVIEKKVISTFRWNGEKSLLEAPMADILPYDIAGPLANSLKSLEVYV